MSLICEDGSGNRIVKATYQLPTPPPTILPVAIQLGRLWQPMLCEKRHCGVPQTTCDRLTAPAGKATR